MAKLFDREYPLGRYIMHDALFNAYLRVVPEGGVEGTVVPGWTKNGFLTLSVRCSVSDSEQRVLTTAAHEVYEYSLRLAKAQFSPVFNALDRYDCGRYRFFFDHDQFTEAVGHAEDMLYHLRPSIVAALRRAKREYCESTKKNSKKKIKKS